MNNYDKTSADFVLRSLFGESVSEKVKIAVAVAAPKFKDPAQVNMIVIMMNISYHKIIIR